MGASCVYAKTGSSAVGRLKGVKGPGAFVASRAVLSDKLITRLKYSASNVTS